MYSCQTANCYHKWSNCYDPFAIELHIMLSSIYKVMIGCRYKCLEAIWLLFK